MVSQESDKARRQFEELVRAYPKSAQGYLLLSELLAQRGDGAGAVNVLRAGVEATGRSSALLGLRLAAQLEATGDADGAIRAYEEILERFPASDPAANNLALLLADTRGDPKSLDRAFELARRFGASDRPEFQDTLGWVLYRRGDYGGAVVQLEKAAASSDQHPEIHYHLGMAYMKAGKAPEAKVQLTKALADGKAHRWADDARKALAQIP
jgi:Flp pilus assembly protein TadD